MSLRRTRVGFQVFKKSIDFSEFYFGVVFRVTLYQKLMFLYFVKTIEILIIKPKVLFMYCPKWDQ